MTCTLRHNACAGSTGQKKTHDCERSWERQYTLSVKHVVISALLVASVGSPTAPPEVREKPHAKEAGPRRRVKVQQQGLHASICRLLASWQIFKLWHCRECYGPPTPSFPLRRPALRRPPGQTEPKKASSGWTTWEEKASPGCSVHGPRDPTWWLINRPSNRREPRKPNCIQPRCLTRTRRRGTKKSRTMADAALARAGLGCTLRRYQQGNHS